MYYDNILIVGSGKFAYECAKIVTRIHQNVEVLEYKPNENISLLENLCRKDKFFYHEMKDDIGVLLKPDKNYLIVSAFNTYIFKKKIVNLPNVNIINYHPSLLPRHPGRNAEAWAIYEGDKKTGITWHMAMDAIDQGDIINQEEINIDESDTSLSLMIKQNRKGIEVFENIIPSILEGNIHTKKQFIKGFIYHKANDKPNGGYLELYWDDAQKSQFLRAMDYGKLGILGIPRVKLNHKEYEWKKYRIMKKNEQGKYRICDILIEGIEKDFILENVQEI